MEKSPSSSPAPRSNKAQKPPASGGSDSSPANPVTLAALRTVTAFAEEERLFRRTGKLLVAVSGGADSLAALVLMLQLRERFGFEVVAGHFDHKLRDGSAEDLARVREITGALGVQCLTGEGDVAAMARERRLGVEEAARRMRYQFLAFVAGKERCDALVTGHTLDDQAETVLMRVIRGAGVRGIRGMLPVSEVPGATAQRLVRPLLPLRRAGSVAICAEAGLAPLGDESNADPRFTRNRLRHETLPALRAINPSVDQALAGLAASAREVFGGVEHESFTAQPLERGPNGSLFALDAVRGLQSEALTPVVEREASFFHIEAAINRTRLENAAAVLARGSGSVRFGDAELEASSGKVRIGPVLAEPKAFEPKVLNIPGVTMAGPWRVEAATDPLPAQPGSALARVSLAGLRGPLRLRPLVPGDRMRLRGIDRKVSDILVNEKVPRWDRTGMLALVDASGVLALVGGPPSLAGEDVPGDDALFIRVTLSRRD